MPNDDQAVPDGVARELSAFPIRFSEPVYFGDPPSSLVPGNLNNGTATIVDLGAGPLAVTCSHVLKCYRYRLASSPNLTFQIGNLKLNPLPRILDEDGDLDLATLDLEGCDLEQMRAGKVVDSSVFRPIRWPPPPLQSGEFIAVGGFPAVWRTQSAPDQIEYDSFSIGATPVTLVQTDYFVCQFQREHWLGSHSDLRDVRELGGMSGGPAFIHRALHAEWVGVVYQFSKDFDLMYLRPTSLLRSNGSIGPD